MTVRRHKSKITFTPSIQKADTRAVVNLLLEVEDEFTGLYDTSTKGEASIITPLFNPMHLQALCTRNNILQQCIHAMEVNVDGTGHTLDPIEDGKEDEGEKKRLEAFLKEPYPGVSLVTMRRRLRYDLESMGYGFLEVLRNGEGKLAFVRHIPGSTLRLVRLDAPVPVTVTLERGEEKVTSTIMTRERRFVQKVGTQLVYFKEYGASRDLNRLTGAWATGKLPLDQRASEVLYFTVDQNPNSPYGVPRWINNLPSVLGSRKSEEFNLEFFDSGGIPPAIIFVQGGALATDVRDQLIAYLSGAAKSKQRAAVVEAQSTSGSLDSAGTVKVSVERFGDGKQDALFQTYDKNCEERIRTSFRLPPIFLGKSTDYNFASALTGVMLAEAQVFSPERREFDEIFNTTVMKALGAKNYVLHSNPVVLKNADVQLKALELSGTSASPESFIKELNDVSGLTLEVNPNPPPLPGQGASEPDMDPALASPKEPSSVITKGEVDQVALLVGQWIASLDTACPAEEREQMQERVSALKGESRQLFGHLLAARTFSAAHMDPAGLADLATCCSGH